jgi:exocyst complex component 4
MSRAPPFPTRRRSPSASNGSQYQSPPVSAPGTAGSTRPLQISRPVSSRSTTPVGSYTSGSPSYSNASAAIGPSRPQRSERRARPDYTGSDRGSTFSQDAYNRDSVSTSRSDIPSSYRPVPNNIITNNGPPPRNRPPRLLSPVSDDGSTTTPTSLSSALTAFQSAASRRRQQSEDNDDYVYRKEREEEIEAEKVRQQRIRDKAPGMRNRGNTRGGEIDGTS